ncbi:YqaJ viral recombinase family protein [Endozoicomonas sp. ALC066]|uniref:YqaJ viral recombinase family nuclease n=1 Tax=Endozoicomonas sp. ALC066 TaxID=3403078 RepID=UPI003BB5F5A6
MRAINLTQGTDEWKAWRMKGITATDSSIILNKNPDTTPWQLWAYKTGQMLPPDISGNPFVRRGNRLEVVARKWMQERFNTILQPLCAEYDQASLLRASFDGISDSGIPVELKAPSENNFDEVLRLQQESTPYKLHYYQVQHQLLVAGADVGYLVYFHETRQPLVFEVKRNQSLIDQMVEEGLKFWKHVNGISVPALDPERDIYLPETADQEKKWLAASASYRKAERAAKELEDQVKKLKGDMKDAEKLMIAQMGNFRKADYGGLVLTRFDKQGTIDYKKYLNEKFQIDETELENYRRKATSGVRITTDKDYIGLPTTSEEVGAESNVTAVSGWF